MPERFVIAPDPKDPRLTRAVDGVDHDGNPATINVVMERPLTIYLNSQEIVTGIDYDDELEVIVVRTARATDYEEKLKKKTRTSGCAVGTVFGDIMEGLQGVILPSSSVRTSWLYSLAQQINTCPQPQQANMKEMHAGHHRHDQPDDGHNDGSSQIGLQVDQRQRRHNQHQ